MSAPRGTQTPIVLDPAPREAGVSAGYLDVAGGVMSFLHRPHASACRSTGIVLIPPFGWEEVASYRARRLWADELAASGHMTLRIDLPGTGDSAGAAGDPERLALWREAVRGAACRLRGEPGVQRIAAIGLGLGGLVAALAAADGGPIDELVLWGTPTTGRAAVRRQRALGRLQSNQQLLADEQPFELPEGWLEVGGFLLSPELLSAVAAVDVGALDLDGLQRVLMIPADGTSADEGLVARLRGMGVVVEAREATGEYAAMVDHPGRVELPRATQALVAQWLLGERGASTREARPVTSAQVLTLGSGPTQIEETPVWLGRAAGRLFGVLTTPTAGVSEGSPCVILLNGGAVRRSGPNRIWAEAARRWALRGVATLRLDLPAIGDSDGDSLALRRVDTMYDASMNADVRAATDELERRGLGSRFVVGGLCTGAYRAFHAALSDERVAAVALINPRALIWNAELLPRREARKFRVRNLLSPAQWRRLLTGELPLATVRRSLAARGRLLAAKLRKPEEAQTDRDLQMLETALDDLGSTEVAVIVGFSGNEPLRDELRAQGLLDAEKRWPTLTALTLPSNDHELRPLAAQAATHALLDQALAAGLRRVEAHSSS